MTEVKYIIYMDPATDEETPIIFPFWLNHSHVAAAISVPATRPLSAGFVRLTDGNVIAYGGSVTLNVKSRGEYDSEVIAKALGLSKAPIQR